MTQELNLEKLKDSMLSKFNNASNPFWIVDQILSLSPLPKLFELLDLLRDDCPNCKGWRYKWTGKQKPNSIENEVYPCKVCQGTGKSNWNLEKLDKLIELLKLAEDIERLVVLDKDQSLPSNLYDPPFQDLAEQNMVAQGWRKVIQKEGK